jgi:hypothetical protein
MSLCTDKQHSQVTILQQPPIPKQLLSFEPRRQTTIVICTVLRHFWDQIVTHQCPTRGGSLKGGRDDKRRTRRSKRGDHGPASPAFGETRKSRLMDDGGVKTIIAIFGHDEQILAPLAIPKADDGKEPHIHCEDSPLANSQAVVAKGSSATPSRGKSSSLAQLRAGLSFRQEASQSAPTANAPTSPHASTATTGTGMGDATTLKNQCSDLPYNRHKGRVPADM